MNVIPKFGGEKAAARRPKMGDFASLSTLKARGEEFRSEIRRDRLESALKGFRRAARCDGETELFFEIEMYISALKRFNDKQQSDQFVLYYILNWVRMYVCAQNERFGELFIAAFVADGNAAIVFEAMNSLLGDANGESELKFLSLNQILWIAITVFSAPTENVKQCFNARFLQNCVSILAFRRGELTNNVFFALANAAESAAEFAPLFEKSDLARAAGEAIDALRVAGDDYALALGNYLALIRALRSIDAPLPHSAEDCAELFLESYVRGDESLAAFEPLIVYFLAEYTIDASEARLGAFAESAHFPAAMARLGALIAAGDALRVECLKVLGNATSTRDDLPAARLPTDVYAAVYARGLCARDPAAFVQSSIVVGNALACEGALAQKLLGAFDLLAPIAARVERDDSPTLFYALKCLESFLSTQLNAFGRSLTERRPELLELLLRRVDGALPRETNAQLLRCARALLELGDITESEGETRRNVFATQLASDAAMREKLESAQSMNCDEIEKIAAEILCDFGELSNN